MDALQAARLEELDGDEITEDAPGSALVLA